MDVTLVSISDVSKEVEIHATSEELKPHFDKAYQEYRPKIEIKGFRKGKAPLDMIKKLYGELIENEYLDKLASELYRQAVQEKDLKPIGEPTLVDLDYKRGEHFRFKIKYEVRPSIALQQYKGLSVKAVVHRLEDAEVEEEIDRLRKGNSTLEEVEKATDDEHVVTAEMQELDDSGIPIIGKKTENARFYLADPQLEKPFKDALTEAAKGNEHTIRFEHQHGDHSHKVNVKLNVTNVQKVILPELNDELVKKVTKDKIANVDEFRKSLREDLDSYWKEKNRRSHINAIIAEIIRLHEFEVPESLVRSVIEGLVEEIKNQSQNKQLPQNFDFEKFYQENREYALYQSRWALLREEIVKAENFEVDEPTLVALAEREAPKIGIDKERLITYYKSSEQVKDRLVSDKLIDLLISSSTIEDVDDTTVQDSLLKG
ncbi:MAG: trigger factor [Ignavibacteria bacterium GWA2_55_25]|nr:MAG: trigger factor [Ignavibacteria bacterium GWA2_55_25]